MKMKGCIFVGAGFKTCPYNITTTLNYLILRLFSYNQDINVHLVNLNFGSTVNLVNNLD